ncbi:hypothetical protein [Arthrobacter antioxidans]|uniref:hypothetical protein n=1 Tax=Arthrobacter antioxidans TaxID=2895818 RepID=UPI001FFF4F32|nr:hypothetical protein [Arthrobacter antioxidans]
MCGACGRAVIADPVLGPVRRMRDLLLVAQLVNVLADGLAGGPVVRVIGEGWIVAGRTGRTTPCDTVRELWLAMLDHGRGAGATSCIAERIARSLPGASPLADRVLREGMAAVNDSRGGAASS